MHGALVWLGKEDPIKSVAGAREEDPGRVTMDRVVAAIGGLGLDHAVTVGQLVEFAAYPVEVGSPEQELHNALVEAATIAGRSSRVWGNGSVSIMTGCWPTTSSAGGRQAPEAGNLANSEMAEMSHFRFWLAGSAGSGGLEFPPKWNPFRISRACATSIPERWGSLPALPALPASDTKKWPQP